MATLAAPLAKPAETAHPIHPLLAERWSPRAFADRPVDAATLRGILEAARWAPSAGNQQPWHFLVATKEEAADHERLVKVLMDGNSRWARHAPVLLLAVAKLYADKDGNPTQRSLYDVGLAVGTLTVQAGAEGVAVHQMGGFHADKAREELHIPEGYEPVAAIALGYPGDPESLPEDLRTRELAPRTRKPLAEFVFGAQWGEESPLLKL